MTQEINETDTAFVVQQAEGRMKIDHVGKELEKLRAETDALKEKTNLLSKDISDVKTQLSGDIHNTEMQLSKDISDVSVQVHKMHNSMLLVSLTLFLSTVGVLVKLLL